MKEILLILVFAVAVLIIPAITLFYVWDNHRMTQEIYNDFVGIVCEK